MRENIKVKLKGELLDEFKKGLFLVENDSFGECVAIGVSDTIEGIIKVIIQFSYRITDSVEIEITNKEDSVMELLCNFEGGSEFFNIYKLEMNKNYVCNGDRQIYIEWIE